MRKQTQKWTNAALTLASVLLAAAVEPTDPSRALQGKIDAPARGAVAAQYNAEADSRFPSAEQAFLGKSAGSSGSSAISTGSAGQQVAISPERALLGR